MLTLNEIKRALKISSNEHDGVIERLLLPCTQEVISYTNNFFPGKFVTEEWISISDAEGEQGLITFQSSLDSLPKEGYIVIRLGSLNNGIYRYSKTADPKQISVFSFMVTGQDYCLVNYCDFPEDVKINFPLLVGYYLFKKGIFEKSESLPGGYSVTYKDKNTLLYELFGNYRVV